MRRRTLSAIIAVTILAVALFGLPLAIAVDRLYHNQAVLRLEREATRAVTAVPASFASSGDPVELPRPEDGTSLGLYDVDGRRLAGTGPQHLERSVQAASRGRIAEATTGGAVVVAVPVANEERVVGTVRAGLPAAAVTRRVRNAWLLLAAFGTAAVAVAAGIARLLADRLARPVVALAGAAARLGEGDFSVRAGTSGIAEVDAVAATLNATAERLGELLTRERSFSADASHQLRTPLAGLRLRLEAAQLTPGADKDRAVADALAEVDRLEATVEELLALARDVAPVRDPLDVDALFDQLGRTWRGRLAPSGRPLRIAIAGPLPAVRASAAAVREILYVLVGNALEPGAGTVTVRARAAPDGLAIEVGDEGPGIAGSIEEAFARRSGSGPGRGIGLAFARSLSEAEGGRLLLHRPGPAPMFILVFPTGRPGPARSEPSPTAQSGRTV